ncbi:MAG: biotin/lipoyl-binding protein [Armatimonadetes bacterium]|nr:biotin/lipoyl-binding protein [Armatimonadota bacterium]MDW8120982.1 biotin/lipoyl-containing protein [Armatimonadota bacterium]
MSQESRSDQEQVLTLSSIQQWIALCQSEDIDELEIQKGNWLVRIKKRLHQPVPAAPPSFSVPALVPVPEPASDPAPTVLSAHIFTIVAPLTGIYYSRPRPDAKPFVQVGSRVAEGTVVALIESMKVFNEVKSEVNGVVKEILAKDGQLVQHGETLMILERTDLGG